MKNLATVVILVICCINCSKKEKTEFTFEESKLNDFIQANFPREFGKDSYNLWSFKNGVKNAKFLFAQTSLTNPDFDTLNQFVLNNDAREYEYLSSDSIRASNYSGFIQTYKCQVLLKKDPPLKGISYHTVVDIKIDTLQIKLESESNGFDMTPTMLEIAKSIKILTVSKSSPKELDFKLVNNKQETDTLNIRKINDSEPIIEKHLKPIVEKHPEPTDKEHTKPSLMYTIKEGIIGDLKLGDLIPENGKFNVYDVRADSKLFKGWEEDFVKMIFIFSQGGTDLFYATRDNASWNKNYENRVDEIHILSKKFRTEKGIGIGSTIEEFITAYPEYELMNAGGRLVIKIKNWNIQFYLNRNDYIGTTILEGPIDYLKPNDFKTNSKIFEIRMY